MVQLRSIYRSNVCGAARNLPVAHRSLISGQHYEKTSHQHRSQLYTIVLYTTLTIKPFLYLAINKAVSLEDPWIYIPNFFMKFFSNIQQVNFQYEQYPSRNVPIRPAYKKYLPEENCNLISSEHIIHVIIIVASSHRRRTGMEPQSTMPSVPLSFSPSCSVSPGGSVLLDWESGSSGFTWFMPGFT